MKNYGKIFKALMVVLIAVSVAILVFGFVTGFESNNGSAVDTLFYWAYAMLAIALFAIIVVGLAISIKNDPKSLIKLVIGLVAVCAVVGVVYAISAGNPAVGLTTAQPSALTLKLTDTVINLTALVGAASILSIVVGEVISAIRNK